MDRVRLVLSDGTSLPSSSTALPLTAAVRRGVPSAGPRGRTPPTHCRCASRPPGQVPRRAALTTGLRGQPDDVRPLSQRVQVASAPISSPDAEPLGSAPYPRFPPPSRRPRTRLRARPLRGDQPQLPDACPADGCPMGIAHDAPRPRHRWGAAPAGHPSSRSSGAPTCRSAGPLQRHPAPPDRQGPLIASRSTVHRHRQGRRPRARPDPARIPRRPRRGAGVPRRTPPADHGAIYVGAYVDGDIRVSHEAAQPGIPRGRPRQRRGPSQPRSARPRRPPRPPLPLPAQEAHRAHDRHPNELFRAFDPTPPQYDFTEYSDREMCAANPLILPGRTASTADSR